MSYRTESVHFFGLMNSVNKFWDRVLVLNQASATLRWVHSKVPERVRQRFWV